MLRNNTTPSIDCVLIDDWREAERTSLERLLDDAIHIQTFRVEHKIIGYNTQSWSEDKQHQAYILERMKRELADNIVKVLDEAGCFSVEEVTTPYYMDGALQMYLDLGLLKNLRKFKEQMKEAIKELTDGIEDI